MSLTTKINEDIKDAMRAKDSERLSCLRMLKSSLKYAAIEKGIASEAELADADVISVIRKRIKQCQDAADGFLKGGRQEQAEKETQEISLLSNYLPVALTAEELADLVKSAIEEIGATGKAQMGAVVKIVMANAEGRIEGKAVSQEVQKQLG